MKSIVFALLIAVLFASSAAAQAWNSNAGGWNTGYGTVYGSFGYAQATQQMYQGIQMHIRRLEQREMMIKQFGRAAVEKSEREARTGRVAAQGPQSAPLVVPLPAPKNYGVFRPDPTVDTGKLFADSLGETAEQKKLIQAVYAATRTAYERQTAAKGWKSNIAGALTFFAVTAMTVYRDSEEPDDQAIDRFYRAANLAIDDVPEFAKIPNREKQQFNNVMIGFAGLLLAGYTEGKQNQDPDTVKAYGQLAGELIRMVFKAEPDRLKLKNGSIVFE